MNFLTTENLSTADVRRFFELDFLFSDFTFDDFIFTPYGYSLNGINGPEYLTIHVTPQEGSPYVSFETNCAISKNPNIVLKHFIEILKPGSFDVLNFNGDSKLDLGKEYNLTVHIRDRLSINYEVDFRYFNKKQVIPEKMFRYKSVEKI